MKRKVSPSTLGIAIGFVLIIICILIGSQKQYQSKEPSAPAVIDFSGSSDYWHCALNIITDYNTEVYIQPLRDDFSFPPTILVSVLYDEDVLSETFAEYIPNNSNDSRMLGRFMAKIESEELTALTDDMLDDYIDTPNRSKIWLIYLNRVTIKIQYGEEEFYTPVNLNSINLK